MSLPAKPGTQEGLRRVPSDIPGRARGGNIATGPGMVPGPGGGVPIPGRPSVPTPGRSIEIPVPWLVRPLGAREINVQADGTGFNLAGSPQVIPGSAFQIPPDSVGVLRSVVLSVNTILVTSQLTWTFRQNGTPIEGWGLLGIFPRAAGNASEAYGPDETFIMIHEGATIDVTFSVGDSAAYQAGVSYHGWSIPKRTYDKFADLYLG